MEILHEKTPVLTFMWLLNKGSMEPKSLSAVTQKSFSQVSIWGRDEESCWQRGFLRKISPPLVSKPQIPALARGLCWMCKKRSGVADEKKGKKTVGCHTNEMQILCVWFLCHELKQKKGKRWNMGRNKHHRAGRASCFIWRIESQHHYSPVITQESRVREKKTRPFLPLFSPLFSHFLSPSLSYASPRSFCFSLSLFGLFPPPSVPPRVLSRRLRFTHKPQKDPMMLLTGCISACLRLE